MSTATITATATVVPDRVDLTTERHDELVQTMITGRGVDATEAEVRAGLLASNAILTAYWSVIVKRARAGLHGAATDDRAGEAGVRAVGAVRSYDPAYGASLITWLARQRVWGGEAVAAAGMPVGVPSSQADRRAAWRAGDREVMLSLDYGQELGEAADSGAAFDLAQDVRTAMQGLNQRDRGWLAGAYGIGGGEPVATEDLAEAAGVSVHTVRRSLARSQDSLREQAAWLAFAG